MMNVSYPEIKEVYVKEDVCKAGANFVRTFSFSAFLVLLVTMLNSF